MRARAESTVLKWAHLSWRAGARGEVRSIVDVDGYVTLRYEDF